jgi:hypothetical protein
MSRDAQLRWAAAGHVKRLAVGNILTSEELRAASHPVAARPQVRDVILTDVDRTDAISTTRCASSSPAPPAPP